MVRPDCWTPSVSTNVIAREAGGITQRIGAYQVTVDLEGEPRKITFLDTLATRRSPPCVPVVPNSPTLRSSWSPPTMV